MDIAILYQRIENGELLKQICNEHNLNFNAYKQKLYRYRQKLSMKHERINYTQVINHVIRKIKMQGYEVDPKLLKIMKECEGPKQRQKRLAMDLIDQINELLNDRSVI